MNKINALVMELKVCRAVLGLSQQQLADLTKLNVQSIKRLEKTGANPKISTLNTIRETIAELGLDYNKTGNRIVLKFKNGLTK